MCTPVCWLFCQGCTPQLLSQLLVLIELPFAPPPRSSSSSMTLVTLPPPWSTAQSYLRLISSVSRSLVLPPFSRQLLLRCLSHAVSSAPVLPLSDPQLLHSSHSYHPIATVGFHGIVFVQAHHWCVGQINASSPLGRW